MKNFEREILKQKKTKRQSNISLNPIYLATLFAIMQSLPHEDAEAATLHKVNGHHRDLLKVKEADPGDRIVITKEPEHGKVIVDQKHDTITYIPDGSGNADRNNFSRWLSRTDD